MKFVLSTPAVYYVEDWPQAEGAPRPRWSYWGWCSLNELRDLIQRNFGHNWNVSQLVARFACGSYGGQHNLPILQKTPDGEPRLAECSQKSRGPLRLMLEQFQPVYVPSGWARRVVDSLKYGATRLQVNKKDLVATDESGEMIVCW